MGLFDKLRRNSSGNSDEKPRRPDGSIRAYGSHLHSIQQDVPVPVVIKDLPHDNKLAQIEIQRRLTGVKGLQYTSEVKMLFDDEVKTKSSAVPTMEEFVRKSIMGQHVTIRTPFGTRKLTYADYTASGRSSEIIETFMNRVVYPLYANTHTEVSASGLQSTTLREEARHIVMKSVNGNEKDALVFTGTGSTSAIHHLQAVLGLNVSPLSRQLYNLTIKEKHKPVVFIGPMEHHSNELSWREAAVTVVSIPEDKYGRADVKFLEEQLVKYRKRKMLIGSFSAGSNVTGIREDVGKVTKTLHKHGALAFWDYAGAGPYVKIDMNPDKNSHIEELDNDEPLDAVFLSPHKFPGGPGTPGVLVAKRTLFQNEVPSRAGGGTVLFVDEASQYYDSNIEAREEAGTPGIVQAIRCGLVFYLRDVVGCERIESLEEDFAERAIKSWSENPNIRLMGTERKAYHDRKRLSIISFEVYREGRRVHHNFITQLLNDLFGIQARSGCSCAGPYGHRLYQNEREAWATSKDYVVNKHQMAWKLGWSRVNFNYFISEEEFNFIVAAVHFVANSGWKFLPAYSMSLNTGMFRHMEDERADHDRLRLIHECHLNKNGEISFQAPTHLDDELAGKFYLVIQKEVEVLGTKCADLARQMWKEQNVHDFDQTETFQMDDDEMIDLRRHWFLATDACTDLEVVGTGEVQVHRRGSLENAVSTKTKTRNALQTSVKNASRRKRSEEERALKSITKMGFFRRQRDAAAGF